jgi:hypothetical protein
MSDQPQLPSEEWKFRLESLDRALKAEQDAMNGKLRSQETHIDRHLKTIALIFGLFGFLGSFGTLGIAFLAQQDIASAKEEVKEANENLTKRIDAQVAEMNRRFDELSKSAFRAPEIRFYHGAEILNGATVKVIRYKNGEAEISRIWIKNVGNASASSVKINLFLPKDVWIPGAVETATNDPFYPTKYTFSKIEIINAQDNSDIFNIRLRTGSNLPIKCKLEATYNSPNPSFAVFQVEFRDE